MGFSWITVLFAFVGGSLTATVISAFVKYWIVHPVISVRLDEKGGFYGAVTVNYFDKEENFVGSREARYFRLRIENTGLSSIRDCCGVITKLTKHTDTGKDLKEEVLDLGWAHHKQSDTRNIPPHAFFYMDVATLLLGPGEREIRLPYFSTTLKDFFTDKGTYEFDIFIGADNARPHVRIPVKFKFDPASDELGYEPLDKSRYPWWDLCSKWQRR